MSTPMDALLGLLIAAIGLLMVVIAFSLADQQKRMISYALAAIVVGVGVFYFGSSEMRRLQMRRTISNLQRQQQINLEEIQKKLGEPKKSNSTP